MKKKKMILGVVIVMGMALLPIPSRAVLQANPNTLGINQAINDTSGPAKLDAARNWMTNIRKMETKNQAMGLEETIDGTTKKATSESNGIDVHMIKNTEWGTMAILSASGYGNSKKLQNSTIKSTTGNKSGIYLRNGPNKEIVAGGLGKIFSGVDEKYYDIYTNDISSAKIGDALGNSNVKNPGCYKWHDATVASWVDDTRNAFHRGSGNFTIFEYDYIPIGNPYEPCRAAVVCGDGF